MEPKGSPLLRTTRPRLRLSLSRSEIMLDHAKTLGVEFKLYSKTYIVPFSVDVIIDAIFGTGLS